MKYNLLSNELPTTKQLRNELKEISEKYVESLNLLPPISYEVLYNIAYNLILENKWKENYQAFVMVCCGNAIWRSVVGSVPFNRRILLLPQCLKNSKHCKAQQDEIGILCADCGACSISNILKDSENIGYLAVVTEGTTIASRLVESGKIDAVIGVGCMEVLQKMYSTVTKYAVPSIAIPLLSCGCLDTMLETDWLTSEIHYFNQNSDVNLLNLNYLKNKTSTIFCEEQVLRLTELGTSFPEKIAIESILAGGQRLRPFFTLLAYEAFCNTPNPLNTNRLALCVECFHKASLIHDDIEDNDDFRYNQETLHKKYGVASAINTGDLLTGLGYKLLSDCDLLPSIHIRCQKIIANAHCKLSVGQGTELHAIENNKILTVDESLFVFLNKTSEAFRVALLLGAAAGGANDDDLEILGNFCTYIGISYQIQDDLCDYSGNRGDIEYRKNSFVLSALFDKLDSGAKYQLLNAINKRTFEIIYKLIDEQNVLKEVENILVKNINLAKNSLLNLKNIGLKIALHEILGKVFKDYI